MSPVAYDIMQVVAVVVGAGEVTPGAAGELVVQVVEVLTNPSGQPGTGDTNTGGGGGGTTNAGCRTCSRHGGAGMVQV